MKIEVEKFSQPCSCGKTHRIVVKEILIEERAILKIPEILKRENYGKNPVIICDENTYRAAGEQVCSLLPGSHCIRLCPENLHANEIGVQKVLDQLPDGADILLAVGSGTIHDLTRFVAHQKNIPFLSVPTAASVDGFVSTVAAMTWHGYKKTFPAVAPLFVVADSLVFSKAPYRLTASGISDLMGKYTALADWKIANLVTGEYFCENIYNLEIQAIQEVRGCISELQSGKTAAYEQLMYALLLSGLAMQMIGNSRPASGAEHHISHLIEMEVVNPHVDAYHGEKVGVGLLIAASVYHRMAKALKAGQFSLKTYAGLEMDLLQKSFVKEEMYAEMIAENTPDPLAQITDATLLEKAGKIADILQEIPSYEELSGCLQQAHCPRTLQDIGLQESLLPTLLDLSPYVRNRLTFMRLKKRFSF